MISALCYYPSVSVEKDMNPCIRGQWFHCTPYSRDLFLFTWDRFHDLL